MSLLRNPSISRKSLRKEKIGVDELILFQAANKIVDIDSISKKNSPENFTFERLAIIVCNFKMKKVCKTQ